MRKRRTASRSALSGGGRRQRRRAEIWATRLLALIVLLGVIGTAAVMAATGSLGGRTIRATGVLAPAPGRAPTPHRRPYRSRPADVQARAVDAALRYTPFIAQGVARRRVIALTFDDGPSPYTEAVVSTLVQMHVPATFFVVGQQLSLFSAGLRDEIRHGFVIADHTQNHAWLVRLTAAAQSQQIREAAQRLVRFGVAYPRLFRPPYGAYDRTTIGLLDRLRMLMVMWSIDPSDWRRPGTGAIVSNVLGNARPGAIVIMHDGGGDRSQTVAALPAIVNGLRRRGYTLVTVPELLRLDPPPRGQKLPHLSGV